MGRRVLRHQVGTASRVLRAERTTPLRTGSSTALRVSMRSLPARPAQGYPRPPYRHRGRRYHAAESLLNAGCWHPGDQAQSGRPSAGVAP